MAYDLLFKNTKRNWARVGDDLDDPDGVMSPTFLSKKPTKPTRQTRKLDPDAPMPPTFLSKKPTKLTHQTRMLDDSDAVMAPTFDGEDDPLGDSCGSLNDDEATVALEGGSSEREALLRMRGWGWRSPFRAIRKAATGLKKGAQATGRGLARGMSVLPAAMSTLAPGGQLMLRGDDELGARSSRGQSYSDANWMSRWARASKAGFRLLHFNNYYRWVRLATKGNRIQKDDALRNLRTAIRLMKNNRLRIRKLKELVKITSLPRLGI